jgi:outer membrane protein insertion porin family
LRSRRPNPYYTDDGVSRGYEVYLRTTEPPALNIGSYTIKQHGGRVSFGVPFSEVDTVFFGIGLERSRITTDITSPMRFKNT